jgi:succinate dehydrogenase/fumarate reductase flavoprotein subunit
MAINLECDVLVVGTGGAGCRAALTARECGARVIQIAKGPIGRCELTVMTMPGFGALMSSNPKDSRENFFLDTIAGGSYLNDRDLVSTLADGSEEAIRFLEGLGVRFDRCSDGTFMYYSGVEHTKTSTPRQLGVDDCMGRAFYNVLSGEIGRSGIKLMEDIFAISLLSDGNRVRGLYALDIRRGESLLIWAPAVVLATGGVVGLYTVRTGHPRDTADGHAMVLREGVPLKDIEFIQSNPAAFYFPESVRGVIVPGWYLVMDRGAKYYNGKGEEFLHLYDPVRRENTTRDIKARAMHQEMVSGRASEHGAIYLDFTGAELEAPLEDYLSENAPFLLDYVRRLGLPPDVIFQKPMEVGPAAHYSCGGIAIDANCETSMPGLLAAGEATGGVHGANRLGNSAMSDIFVFGRLAGERAAVLAQKTPRTAPSAGVRKKLAELDRRIEEVFYREPKAPIRPAGLRAEIEEIMFRCVGFGRDEKGLLRAIERLAEMKEEALPRTKPSSRSRIFNYDLVEIFELANLLDIGQAVARAALERTETRGCHNRLDYPDQDDQNWLVHILVSRQGDRLVVDKSPVVMMADPMKD